MAPLDYFDKKIDGMKLFYTWLGFIGQPQKFLVKKLFQSCTLPTNMNFFF
jgi:hypothetical protein